MKRYRGSNHLALLASLFLAGCAATGSHSERRPPKANANAITSAPQTQSAVVVPSHGSAAIARTAYVAPDDTPSEPPSIKDGTAPGTGGAAKEPVRPVPVAPPSSQERAGFAIATASDAASDADDPFSGQVELSAEQLVAEVENRNPSLQAASDAWRAATQRYPQVVSLDDPMFTAMMSPRGVGMDNGGGWMVQASQKLPWAGKRALRGQVASAEANVMQGDVGDTRLRLAEAARVAFFDFYMAHRLLEVNATTETLVKQLRDVASNKYQVGQVTQQDILQADVELADLATRRAELIRDQQVAQARINTLLHRGADHPLPPPLKEVKLPDGLPAVDRLQELAERSRPDLFAQSSRIQAEQANLALAWKEYYPDVNLAARYDGFMPQDMRAQVGFDINIPIRYGRRSAAVCEASDRVAQRRAEYQALVDQVQFEVRSSHTRVVQAGEVVRLYREKTLPASEINLQSAQTNYTTGKVDFLRLLDAERQLLAQREKYYTAIAEYHRRLAELERAVGEPVR